RHHRAFLPVRVPRFFHGFPAWPARAGALQSFACSRASLLLRGPAEANSFDHTPCGPARPGPCVQGSRYLHSIRLPYMPFSLILNWLKVEGCRLKVVVLAVRSSFKRSFTLPACPLPSTF